MIRAFMLFFILWPSVAHADRLGCYEPSAVVSGAAGQFQGTATSVTAKVLAPGDSVATPSFTPVVTDRTGDRWEAANFTLSATPTFGNWTVRFEGTVNGVVGRGTDTFEVRAVCPLKPTTAGRTLDVTAANKVNGVVLTDTATTVTSVASGGITATSLATNTITAAKVADGALRATSEIAVTKCNISASTSGISFTIATCTSPAGETITLADGSFAGRMMEAYTNGGTPCNVVGERVFVQTVVAGVVTVRTSTVTGGQGGFTATPNATNCGVYF